MAFNFPNTPTEGQIFTDATSGAQYVYRNGVWMQSSAAQIKVPALAESVAINGSFQVSQEYGSTAVSASGAFPADQWMLGIAGYTATAQKTTDTPTGAEFVGFQNIAARAPAAADYISLVQAIEGTRFAALRWAGTAAIPAVLNFKAKTTVDGTYGCSVRDSAGAYSIAFDIPITVANGWKEFTFPIPAPTVGTWLTGNAVGGFLTFANAVGANWRAPSNGTWVAGNFSGSAGMTNPATSVVANLAIRDVQLVPDPQSTGAAPAFVAKPYADELEACKRYYRKFQPPTDVLYMYGYNIATAGETRQWSVSPQMRAAPAAAITGTYTASNCSNLTPTGYQQLFSLQTTVTAQGAWVMHGGANGGLILNARM